MTLTTAEDISIVLSGGTNNLDPNLSVGGDPASAPIVDGVLNNLFDDVSPEEAEDGVEDYRCIYIFNDGPSVIYTLTIYIASDFDGGASIELGIEDRSETQRIAINSIPDGGSMTLSYEGISFVSTYNGDLGEWALSLQDSLNSLVNTDGIPLLQEATVTAEVSDGSTIFDVNFNGLDSNKNHSEIVVVENNISPESNINVTTPQRGAPIDTIAPEINSELTPPGGVSFFPASDAQPISLPQLFPDSGFPLWIKRTVIAGTTAVASDGFTLRFSSESLPL